MKNILGLVLSIAINAAVLGSLQHNVSQPRTPHGEVYITELRADAADAGATYASLVRSNDPAAL